MSMLREEFYMEILQKLTARTRRPGITTTVRIHWGRPGTSVHSDLI